MDPSAETDKTMSKNIKASEVDLEKEPAAKGARDSTHESVLGHILSR